jgi:hypothetical protein
MSKARKGMKHNVKPRIKIQGQSLHPIQLDLPVFDGCEPEYCTEVNDVMSIYAIINTVTGKIYIGSAVDTQRRWYIHRWDLERGAHHSIYLQRAWQKHGHSAFNFRLIEIIEDASLLLTREQYWIEHYHSSDFNYGYNMSSQATRRPSSNEKK